MCKMSVPFRETWSLLETVVFTVAIRTAVAAASQERIVGQLVDVINLFLARMVALIEDSGGDVEQLVQSERLPDINRMGVLQRLHYQAHLEGRAGGAGLQAPN